IISRIKLYYRPAKLALPPDQAATLVFIFTSVISVYVRTFLRDGGTFLLARTTTAVLLVTETDLQPYCRWRRIYLPSMPVR
ncbi:hypothetical protein O5472_26810, partial [Escherichia coli]|nr:hypothetical protein [Escherichia coli]